MYDEFTLKCREMNTHRAELRTRKPCNSKLKILLYLHNLFIQLISGFGVRYIMFSIGWVRANYEMSAFPFLIRVVFILKLNRIKIPTLLTKFCCMFTLYTRTNILTVVLFVDENNLNNRSNVEEN